MGGEVKINLGSGAVLIQDWVNVDSREIPGVETVDLNVLPWPWADNSVDMFAAMDSIEHLHPLGKAEGQMNIVAILREVWRCLKPGGMIYARIPSTDSFGAFQDPTHVTYWNENTWWYFDISSQIRPPDWPPFEVHLSREAWPERGLRWVLVKAKKVGYPIGG